MSRYRLNAARRLYDEARHPRLLFGARDLPRLQTSLKSTTWTSGRDPPPTRRGSERSRYFPARAFCQLSSDGVAEPSTQGTPSIRARITATSRP